MDRVCGSKQGLPDPSGVTPNGLIESDETDGVKEVVSVGDSQSRAISGPVHLNL
jgi:hypothetical protein